MKRSIRRWFRRSSIAACLALSLMACVLFYLDRTITMPTRAKEQVLLQNLYTIRSAIEQFEENEGCPPHELEELIASKYLRRMPLDPTTRREDTWVVQRLSSAPPDELPHCPRRVIRDVRSGSTGLGLDGRPHSSW
ncbi:MAG: hypothetical protein AAGA81_08120 [Acidobacteriota bacterium]